MLKILIYWLFITFKIYLDLILINLLILFVLETYFFILNVKKNNLVAIYKILNISSLTYFPLKS